MADLNERKAACETTLSNPWWGFLRFFCLELSSKLRMYEET